MKPIIVYSALMHQVHFILIKQARLFGINGVFEAEPIGRINYKQESKNIYQDRDTALSNSKSI